MKVTTCSFQHGSENLGFCCCAMPIIMALMSKFATYRGKVERVILLVKIANRYFEGKYFLVRQFRSFDASSVKVTKTLYLPDVHSKHTTSYTG